MDQLLDARDGWIIYEIVVTFECGAGIFENLLDISLDLYKRGLKIQQKGQLKSEICST